MRSLPEVLALIGAQYGSEGKGAVAASIADQYDVHVRVGGPNAGHTIVHQGKTWKMRSVPCGWVNPSAYLVIGAGAVIDPEVLNEEVWELERDGYEIGKRLLVDYRASVITSFQRQLEGGTTGQAHKQIGSTGEGVGASRIAKLARGIKSLSRIRYERAQAIKRELPGAVIDTVAWLHHMRSLEQVLRPRIMLEGTQGSGLSLTHGSWPHVTSHDTNAAQLAADVGLPPNLVESLLVARTFPIRVAGNSGPLRNEIAWNELDVEPELTTVTQKVRRVARFDAAQVLHAVQLNNPIGLVLTFMDYIDPAVVNSETLTDKARDFAVYVARHCQTPVLAVGTGPETIIWEGQS